jgi:hypothetical protein
MRNQVHEDRRTNRMSTVSAVSVAANDKSIEGLPPSVLEETLGQLAGRRRRGCWRCRSGSGSAFCTS